MSTLVFDGPECKFILSDAADLTAWPLIDDGDVPYFVGIPFTPTVVKGVIVTVPIECITLAGKKVVQTPPEVPPVEVPATVSPRQIRQALTAAGLRAQVETAVAAGDQDLKDWWGFSQDFQRSHAEVAVMAQALGKTDAEIDQVFILAGSL